MGKSSHIRAHIVDCLLEGGYVVWHPAKLFDLVTPSDDHKPSRHPRHLEGPTTMLRAREGSVVDAQRKEETNQEISFMKQILSMPEEPHSPNV